jgi:D-sedoheptulose 7-phosphate isomerase
MSRKELIKEHFTEYRKKLDSLLDQVNVDDLEKVLTAMIAAFKNGNTVYVCGNGGSAATASHMQVDFSFFVRYFTNFRPRFIALTDNVPMLTAVGNDTSFDDIFVEQMKGRFNKGDVIICISASGNSENVIRAAEYANEMGGTSIGFIGFSGGKLKETVIIPLYTENPKGEYGPIEDLHMIYDHLMVNYLIKDPEFLAIETD